MKAPEAHRLNSIPFIDIFGLLLFQSKIESIFFRKLLLKKNFLKNGKSFTLYSSCKMYPKFISKIIFCCQYINKSMSIYFDNFCNKWLYLLPPRSRRSSPSQSLILNFDLFPRYYITNFRRVLREHCII